MPIFHGAGGAGDSTNDAVVTEVANYASQAATSATNAATSATNSSTSASSASTSASNAAASASQAATSANNAASSVVAVQAQVSTATTKASEAAASAVTAATQASNAATSATAADNSADLADASASDAAVSAAAALSSAEDASDAVTDALSLYGDAQALSDAVDDAETAATNAASSASAASGSATTATNAASTATTQATAANNSAISASSSAAAASTQAGNAATSANSAAESAADALDAYNDTFAIYGSTEAVNAAVSNSQANRDAAAASATAASNSASASATSATASATSASAAATSAAQASAVALGNEPVRHSVRPSLLLDFANTKTLDPRITFTRASTGTFYDGKTVAKAEENLFQQSQTIDNAYWNKFNSSATANSDVAPDGTTTADTLTINSQFGCIINTVNLGLVAGLQYTISFWAKNISGTNTYDVWNNTLNSSIGTFTPTGSWVRYSFTFTPASTTNVINPVQDRNASGFGSVLVWGIQLEQRSSVTAYTATTTAPITNYIPALQTAAANVARFEHNPVTGESLGLEIEEQRTNLVLRSEEFDNASWTKDGATITANAVVAPDGALTADKLVENTATSQHRVYATQGSTTPTVSVYVKYSGRQWFRIEFASGSANAWFDIQNGVVGTTTGSVTSTIQSVGNGWYRVTATRATTTSFTVFALASADGSEAAYAGNGFSGIYIWGAQLEAGSFATSYIPTVASQVTRSADAASMTGTNFSSWYRADEGTMYADVVFNSGSVTTDQQIFHVDDGSTTNRNKISRYAGVLYGTTRSSGTVWVDSSLGTANANTALKVTYAFKTRDFAGTVNAGTVATVTNGLVPVGIAGARIGTNAAGTGEFLNGSIKKIAFYGKRLTNAELQGLTTV